MKLSTFMIRMKRIERMANEQGIDPEIMLAVLPNFPEACTVKRVISSVEGHWRMEDDWPHEVYIAEDKDLGYIKSGIDEACWKIGDRED
jgi:hypothetical protein